MTKRSRTVLFIDYFFPPVAGPGVRRTLGFVNHLPAYGWNAVILTAHAGDTAFSDASLLEQVPSHVDVHRAYSIEPLRSVKRLLMKRTRPLDDGHPEAIGTGRAIWGGGRWLKDLSRWVLFPDRHVGWFPFALRKGRQILRSEPVDVIYSTMTSVTSHFVAYRLWREFRVPWVADFQDPWTQHGQFPSGAHKELARSWEARIYRSADRITVTTEQHRTMLLQGFPGISEDKVTVIPLGYDPDIFSGLTPDTPRGFVITHFGAFYATRSPALFLRAVAQCLAERPEMAQDLRIRFVGHFDADILEATERIRKEHRLEQIVSLERTVPYALGLQILLGSSLLLFIADKGIWGRVMSSAKLPEYLGARRPILGLVPDGAIAATIRAANAGYVVDPDDLEAIKGTILEAYDLWRRDRLAFPINEGALEDLTWYRLTGRFTAVLDGVARPLAGSVEVRGTAPGAVREPL